MKKRIVIVTLVAALAVMAVPLMATGNPLSPVNTEIESSLKKPVSITHEEAKKIAVAMLPSGSILVHLKSIGDEFQLKYYGSRSKELYSITLFSENGSLRKLETQAYLPATASSTGANLKETAVHKIVSDEIKEAKITNTELDIVNGNSQYVIRFQAPKLYGNYTINAQNGSITDRVIKTGTPISHDATTNFIPWSQLKNNALFEVPGGIVTDVNFIGMSGTASYKVEVCKGSMQHILFFNVFTGKLISESSQIDGWNDNNYQLTWHYKEHHPFNLIPDTIASSIIDTTQAVEIAKRRAPQGILEKIKLYYHDDKGVYEGKLKNGKLEYYFKIDAVSGKILYWGGDNSY